MFHSASGDSPGHKEGPHVSGSLWVESLESLESQTPMLGSMGDFYEVNWQVSVNKLKERLLCAIKIFLWNNSQFCNLVYRCFRFDSQTVAKMVKNLPAIPETWIWSLGQEDTLEKETSIHSSILAWRFPWTEEPGGLHSIGSQRVGPNWRDWACMRIWFAMLC